MSRKHLSILILVVLLTYTSWGATHYVVPRGTAGVIPTPNYLTWGTAATNIQHAVSVATNNSLVLVTNGTHYVTNQILIRTAITLRSFNHGAVDRAGTIINGGYPARSNRCVFVTNVTATIDGFTLTKGFAGTAVGGYGGGVYLYSKGTVTNCTITGNGSVTAGGGVSMTGSGLLTMSTITANGASNYTAGAGGYGGGIYMNGGTIRNSTISANRSGFQGGGIWMYTSGGTITDCTIAGNLAQPLPGVAGNSGYGGALWSGWGGTVARCTIVSNTVGPSTTAAGVGAAGVSPGNGMLVRDSLIAYNSSGALGYGGGIQVGTGRIVSNCVIRNNTAANGGGVYPGTGGQLLNCTVTSNSSAAFCQGGTMRNCLFAKNTGGIWIQTGGTLQNCTIADNTGVGVSFSVPGRVENCVVYNNNAGARNWSTNATGNGTTWTNSCTWPVPPGVNDIGNITNAPAFVNRTAGNYRLSVLSPCVDKGFYRSWMATGLDRDLTPRIYPPAVDMGAYETIVLRGSAVIIR